MKLSDIFEAGSKEQSQWERSVGLKFQHRDERDAVRTEFKKSSEILNFLRERGYRKVGEGLYAEVLAKAGGGNVIKFNKAEGDPITDIDSLAFLIDQYSHGVAFDIEIALDRWNTLHQQTTNSSKETIAQVEQYVTTPRFRKSKLETALNHIGAGPTMKDGSRCMSDLHSGNVMVRPRDLKVVIIDPWALT